MDTLYPVNDKNNENSNHTLNNSQIQNPDANNSVPSVNSGGTSTTATVVTIILLLTFMPIGLIVMWFWTKWSLVAKILITIPAAFMMLVLGSIIAGFVMTVMNPVNRIESTNAICIKTCGTLQDEQKLQCLANCEGQKMPANLPGSAESIMEKQNDINKQVICVNNCQTLPDDQKTACMDACGN